MLLAVLGWVSASFAAGIPGTTRIPGGGKSKADCYAEFDVVGVTSSSNKIACTDGDPCDTDGKCDGKCTFSVRMCVNQTDITGCTSTALKKAPKVTKNLLTVPSFTAETCGFGNIVVPLKGKKKNKKGSLKVVVTAISTTGKPATDKDTLNFSCTPRVGACPTTTTTTLPAPAGTLSFSPTIRTTTCGGPSSAGFTTPGAPFSGEVDDGASTKVSGGDLGLGCLYVGGGTAAVAASLIPDGTTTFLTLTGTGPKVALTPSAGTGPENCSKGAGPGKHCIAATNNGGACTMDSECGGNSGSCAPDANCFFGPPLPITNTEAAALSTCVLNVISADASGSATPATGIATNTLPLASRVYLTSNATAPCPVCVDTICSGDGATRCFVDADCAQAGGTCSKHFGTISCLGGEKDGGACTPIGTLKTTFQCPPKAGTFQAPLSVTLGPLTSDPASPASLTATKKCVLGPTPGVACTTDGGCGSGGTCQEVFCPMQSHGGAFHFPTGHTVKETGLAAGDLSDHAAHHSILASVFCIPGTGNVGIDTVASLPGPGAIAIDGMAQLH